LQSLSAAVSDGQTRDPDEALELVQRQLPYINRRLQATMEKLRDPAEVGSAEGMAAAEWWQELQNRYGDGSVEFSGYCAPGSVLPRELFDTVAENLLENARYKQSIDRRVRIWAELDADESDCRLRICDSGAPVPEPVAQKLFGGAVASAQGLGIGLHQCARLAERLDYDLRLESNEPGAVYFLLRG
jgi:signal transduction histidine kinase